MLSEPEWKSMNSIITFRKDVEMLQDNASVCLFVISKNLTNPILNYFSSLRGRRSTLHVLLACFMYTSLLYTFFFLLLLLLLTLYIVLSYYFRFIYVHCAIIY